MKTALSEYTKTRDNNYNLIRFVAALLVLITHSFALALGGGDAEPLKNSIGMTLGTIAVDVFFVTSGFLIASSFFERNNIIAFAWARILRIYPALIVAIAFCTFIVGLFFTTHTTYEYLSNPDVYRYFMKNITLFFGVEYMLPGVFESIPYKNAVNGSIWTLPYEVKMYFLLAVISSVAVSLKSWLGASGIQIIFLCIGVIAVAANILNHFYFLLPNNFTHLFSMFFIGSMFYLCRDKIFLSNKTFIFMSIILLSSFFDKDLFFVIYCITIPYMVLYMAYVPAGDIRGFNKIGDYSYGIYIYAFPVQQSIASLVPNISVPIMILLSFVVTFILSVLSWHFVEEKALKFKRYYNYFVDIIVNYTPYKN